MSNRAEPLLSMRSFEIIMWTLSGICTLFLVTRIAVRMKTKGKLMFSDYLIVAALPMLFVGFGLLQSVLESLYWSEMAAAAAEDIDLSQSPSKNVRIAASLELLWVVIYCAKFCFLAQFKFYKAPYAYVDPRLTKYYWTVVGTCVISFLITIIQPAVMCSGFGSCRFGKQASNRSWETAVTVIDIGSDILVISIPALLLHMVNLSQAHTYINYVFKSLSVFAIAAAAARISLQYNGRTKRINYTTLAFLLAVEAAIAIIMSSISSYRVILLDCLANKRGRKTNHSNSNRLQEYGREPGVEAEPYRSLEDGDGSLAELPILAPKIKAPRSTTEASTIGTDDSIK